MTREEISRRVQKCAAESLGIEDRDATPEKTLEDLGADSLDRVEFQMCLEDEFLIEITDEDGSSLRTIQQVIDYIAGRVKS